MTLAGEPTCVAVLDRPSIRTTTSDIGGSTLDDRPDASPTLQAAGTAPPAGGTVLLVCSSRALEGGANPSATWTQLVVEPADAVSFSGPLGAPAP